MGRGSGRSVPEAGRSPSLPTPPRGHTCWSGGEGRSFYFQACSLAGLFLTFYSPWTMSVLPTLVSLVLGTGLSTQ